MKILTFKLLAFGPFTNKIISLDRTGGGFHLFYGPNEAGKSSALRAIRQALYGMDHNSADAFRHPTNALRLGIVVAPQGGGPFEFVRRKGNKNTLREGDDQTPFAEETIRSALAGVDQAIFKTMFGIDHVQLREGGEEIMAGKGHLAETLFSAASGIRRLQSIKRRLDEECEAIYKKRGSSQKLPILLNQRSLSVKTLKELPLTRDKWLKTRNDLEGKKKQQRDCAGRLSETRIRRGRFERQQRAFLPVQKWKHLQNQLARTAGEKEFSAEFCTRFVETLDKVEAATTLCSKDRDDLNELERQMGEPVLYETILAEVGMIERFREKLGSHLKAADDRLTLTRTVEGLRRDADRYLRQLGEMDCAFADSLYEIPAGRKARIHELGAKETGFAEKRDLLHKALADLRIERDQDQKRLETFSDLPDEAALRKVLRRIHAQGDLEFTRSRLEREVKIGRANLHSRFSRLPFWNETLAGLFDQVVPSVSQLDRFEVEYERLTERRNEAMRANDSLRGELQSAENRLKKLESGGTVPTEDQLKEVRADRDRLWRRFLSDVLAKEWPSTETMTTFQDAVRQADVIADQLRFESKHVAQKVTLIQDIENFRERLLQSHALIAELVSEQEAWETRWKEAWQGLALKPGTPSEMRQWLLDRENLLVESQKVSADEALLQEADQAIVRAMSDIESASRQAGLWNSEHRGSLNALIDLSSSALEERESQKQEVEALKKAIADRDRNIPKAEDSLRRHDELFQEWLQNWTEAIRGLGLGAAAPAPEVFAFLQTVDTLSETLRKLKSEQHRIDGIDADATSFQSDLRSACERFCPESLEQSVEEQVGRLSKMVRSAESSFTARATLEKQHQLKNTAVNAADRKLSSLEDQLQTLCNEAGIVSRSDLRGTIHRAQERRKLEHDLKQCEEQIDRECGTASLSEFVEHMIGLDPDLLGEQVRSAKDEESSLEEELSRINMELGGVRTLFEMMDGKGDASEQANLCASQASEILEAARRYAVLRLSAAVMQQGIERYRQKHQHPLLARASNLFSRFTCGSFSGLIPDVSEKGEPILLGVRDDDCKVPVEGMSDGTCDQLYLALRLAGLEAWIEEHGPMPFIVDDVLLHFDDHRSAATLQVLGELSARTQVLFFTHHRRLVELAEKVIPADTLVLHEL